MSTSSATSAATEINATALRLIIIEILTSLKSPRNVSGSTDRLGVLRWAVILLSALLTANAPDGGRWIGYLALVIEVPR